MTRQKLFTRYNTRAIHKFIYTARPSTLSSETRPHCLRLHHYMQNEPASGRPDLPSSFPRDVNKDKFQNPRPRPRTWPSLPRPRPRTWASCSRPRPRTFASQMSRPRPRTLYPQGLFKDFCRLNVSLFITLFYIGLKYIQAAPWHIMLSENQFNATFQNTPWYDRIRSWH